jgi:serine/threonine protein kinase
MITSSGEVRILDFGASSALSRLRSSAEDVQKINSTALTPAYACCELLAGAAADPRDDLYALACVSYELLAGQHPFQRRRSTEARDLGMVAERPRGLTRRQWETLAMGLSWDRQNRSISVDDWIARLNPPLVATRQWVRSLKLKTERSAQWTPSLYGAAALLAILLVSGVLWGSFKRPSSEREIGAEAAVAQAVPQSVANTPILADSTAPQQSFSSAGTSVPMQAIPQTPPLPRRVRTDAAHSALHQGKNNISISAGFYKFRSRQNLRKSTFVDPPDLMAMRALYGGPNLPRHCPALTTYLNPGWRSSCRTGRTWPVYSSDSFLTPDNIPRRSTSPSASQAKAPPWAALRAR